MNEWYAYLSNVTGWDPQAQKALNGSLTIPRPQHITKRLYKSLFNTKDRCNAIYSRLAGFAIVNLLILN